MPEMNGAELLQQARELAPQSYRLLISAVEEFHAAVDSINRGEIYRFVPKPWDRDDLLAIVRGAVDDYHLRRNYQEMTALLHSKNAELSALNKNLEQRVVSSAGMYRIRTSGRPSPISDRVEKLYTIYLVCIMPVIGAPWRSRILQTRLEPNYFKA